ncbi:MAG: hypothetical protein ACK4IT_08845 [Thioalkalivibrionaceae bacterium]
MRAEVLGQVLAPGHGCRHCSPRGCAAYADRPVDPCRVFECGWLDPTSPLPEDMRPDRSGVIVLYERDHWCGLPVDVAIPVGRRIPNKSLDLLKRQAEHYRRPLLFGENATNRLPLRERLATRALSVHLDYFAWGPAGFQQEYAHRIREGLPLWPGHRQPPASDDHDARAVDPREIPHDHPAPRVARSTPSRINPQTQRNSSSVATYGGIK